MIIPSIDLMGGSTVQLIGGREKAVDAGDPLPIAERFGIRAGDEIEFVDDGGTSRVLRAGERRPLSAAERRAIFEDAMKRQQARNPAWWRAHGKKEAPDRGWTRQELYTRGGSR